MPSLDANTPMKAMLKDVWVLMRATLIAQGIGLLLIPLLSRLYGPADFGTFAIYQATLLLISVVACLRYEQAILTAESEAEASALFRLSLIVAALVAITVLLVSALFVAVMPNASKMGTISLFWLTPAIFLTGGALAAGCYFTRRNLFVIAGRSRIAQSVLGGGVSVGFGAAATGGIGLAVGDMAGKSIVTLLALRLFNRSKPQKASLHGAFVVARKYAHFPRYSILGGLLNNGGSFLLPFVLFNIYGSEIAGQYALVDRVISLPLGLVIMALSQAFSAHCGRLFRENPSEALPYFNTLVSRLAIYALLPTALGYLLAPIVFPLVFGAKWALAGHYAQMLALMYFSTLVMGPVNSALIIAGKLRLQLLWEAVRFVLLAVTFGLASSGNWSAEGAISGYAWISIGVNLAFVGMAWNEIRAISTRAILRN
jgi:teichuronic acid exporter